jgi:hypothetical protein
MKPVRILVLIIVIGMLLGLAACSPKTGNTANQTSTDAASSAGQVSSTSAIDGAALIIEKLQNHHDSERIYSAHKTREEWNTTLDRMIGYGAKISEEEKQIIIDYLLSLQN